MKEVYKLKNYCVYQTEKGYNVYKYITDSSTQKILFDDSKKRIMTFDATKKGAIKKAKLMQKAHDLAIQEEGFMFFLNVYNVLFDLGRELGSKKNKVLRMFISADNKLTNIFRRIYNSDNRRM